MFLIFVVGWRCGCGCEHTHRLYLKTHQEALGLVVELQKAGSAVEIWIWRYRLPRRKEAILVALNEAAGLDIELEGELEQLAHLTRDDCEEPAEAELH